MWKAAQALKGLQLMMGEVAVWWAVERTSSERRDTKLLKLAFARLEQHMTAPWYQECDCTVGRGEIWCGQDTLLLRVSQGRLEVDGPAWQFLLDAGAVALTPDEFVQECRE